MSAAVHFTLTINGANFTSTSTAMWGAIALTTQYISSTQLTAMVPAALTASTGTASIAVRRPGGYSSALALTILQPAPTITSLSPANAYAGGSAFTLTINGTNFTSTWTLWWGSTELPSTFISSTQLTALVPAGLIAGAGTKNITVSTVSGRSPAAVFTVIQPTPVIASLSPASTIAGSSDLLLTINGSNFDAASIAFWGSTALATTRIGSSQLTATVSAALTANPGTGSITVSTDGGASSGESSTSIRRRPPSPASVRLQRLSAAQPSQ